jgi:uracil-DNA glycosylase family 4
MSAVGNVYVPHEGRTGANIMIVGEAPGADEERKGRPFIGASGDLLMRYLGRHRVPRHDVWLTNLCKYRPHMNKFETVLGSSQLADGLEELKQEIDLVKPSVIIAMGNWPLYYLTGHCGTNNNKPKPGSGITNYRGSVLPNTLLPGGPKVLATYHPAFIIRPQGFGMHPVFHMDLGRGIEESEFPEIRYPQYTSYINPPDGELNRLVDEMLASKMISIDIETFGSTLACVGMTSSENWGLCMTFEDGRAWPISEYILQSQTPKMFQFGAFDINYLEHFYGWETRGYGEGIGWDTYIASASLMPEFPRGLDFLTSIYTRFPYYKTERKEWKETGDLMTLWEYNIKDIIATLMIGNAQAKELGEVWPLAA